MGAGSSSVTAPPGPPRDAAEPGAAGAAARAEQENGGPPAEAAAGAAPEPPGDRATNGAPASPKLLQKNGQINSINGLPEGQVGDPHEKQEEAVILNVGQRENENMIEKEDMEDSVAARSTSSVQDAQGTVHEIIEQMPLSEENKEESDQPAESQSNNDVGFKKVFKFVGFKLTVKKDKNDKSDPVELLNVKKDDNVGANGADNSQDSDSENEALPKENESTQFVGMDEEKQGGSPLSADPEDSKSLEEEKQEKVGNKSSESESISSFKRFFSMGWAGWRKKASFKKAKEDEPETSEKKKEQEVGKEDIVEIYERKQEDAAERSSISEHLPSQETTENIKDSSVTESEGQGSSQEKAAPLATEVFDEKVETIAEVHVSTVEEQEKTGDQSAVEEKVVDSLFLASVETNLDLQKAEATEKLTSTKELVCASGDDYIKLAQLSLEESALCQQHEGITNEVEILSSQERGKLQGSPLKKLFTGTGLKKLSGKKHKGKRGDDEIKPEESGELGQMSVDTPETPEEQKGESSASSPEELTEITTSVEKGIVDLPQEVEIEEEGTTSDGERKREGVTPWASFKKMVTPKKRVRRLSESDKEEEVEKVKSSTLSSTESAVSDNQEDMKASGDDQKTEEPKRKVDTSVSWEALICVGSSKKRARKSSSSDEEGGTKVVNGDGQKTEDAGKNKDPGTEITLLPSHEGDQGQINSSPELAGSPLEGEGVSTWVSFKRLVTPRKKSKSKAEERHEESVTISGTEHSALDIEPVKEESWVSIKKFIPGRRKKRLDEKHEQVPVEEDQTGVNEEDSDIPAVVPLSEYDAAEQEKLEAQQATKTSLREEKAGEVEKPNEGLVHAVSVTVVEGERAVTSMEERSPSWISATITEPLEEVTNQLKLKTEEIIEKEVLVAKPASESVVPSEVVAAEEITEASCAEETTEMVSAVSQLTDSHDTTEEATPVQEVEEDTPDLEALKKQTEEVLQAVLEKVKQVGESEMAETVVSGDTVSAVERLETKKPEEVKVKKTEQDGDHGETNLDIGDAAVLNVGKEMQAEVKEQRQTAKAEDVTINDRQQEITEQTSSETFHKLHEIEKSIEVRESKSYSNFMSSQDETTDTEASQSPVKEITPVETSTGEGTLVVHFEDISIKQQGHSKIGDSGSETVETTLVTVSSDKPPESTGVQCLQGKKELFKVEEVPSEEQTIVGKALSSGPIVDQETKDKITAKEQVSLDTGVKLLDHTKIDQVELKDEKVPEEDKLKYESNSEKIELQKQIGSSYSASMKEEVLVQEETLSSEILKLQSPGAQKASLPLTATAVEEKIVAETQKFSETLPETLHPVNQLITKKITSESFQDIDTNQAVLIEKQSVTESALQAEARTLVSTVIETAKSSVTKRPEEESQKLLDAANGEIVSHLVTPTLTQVEDGKAEEDILAIESQSITIVQSIIHNAVDQFATTKDLDSQIFARNPEEQAQIKKSEEDDCIHVSEPEAQCEIKSVKTEDLGPAAVEQTVDTPVISGIYKDVLLSEGSEKTIKVQMPELKSSEQKHEESASQLKGKKETKTEPKVGSAMSREVSEQLEHVPKGETKDGSAADHSDVPGESNDIDLHKESLDSNGPKLQETVQGVECQERLVVQLEKEICNQSVEDTKTQTQEEPHQHDESCESPAKSARTES